MAGETHYNLMGMTTFAIAGILSSSTLLLRIPAYVFPFWALTIVALAFPAASGNAAAVAGLIASFSLFIGGTCAAIAIYVARAYKNTLGRPNFIIDRRRTVLQDAVPTSSSNGVTASS